MYAIIMQLHIYDFCDIYNTMNNKSYYIIKIISIIFLIISYNYALLFFFYSNSIIIMLRNMLGWFVNIDNNDNDTRRK